MLTLTALVKTREFAIIALPCPSAPLSLTSTSPFFSVMKVFFSHNPWERTASVVIYFQTFASTGIVQLYHRLLQYENLFDQSMMKGEMWTIEMIIKWSHIRHTRWINCLTQLDKKNRKYVGHWTLQNSKGITGFSSRLFFESLNHISDVVDDPQSLGWCSLNLTLSNGTIW